MVFEKINFRKALKSTFYSTLRLYAATIVKNNIIVKNRYGIENNQITEEIKKYNNIIIEDSSEMKIYCSMRMAQYYLEIMKKLYYNNKKVTLVCSNQVEN